MEEIVISTILPSFPLISAQYLQGERICINLKKYWIEIWNCFTLVILESYRTEEKKIVKET